MPQGGVLVKHLPESTEESPKVETSYILIFSSILDHTALRANQLIDVCLGQRKGHVPLSGIHLVADAGLHFRSYESLCHHCVTLPGTFKVPCLCHWGVEKHIKSACDRLFGWLNGWITRAKKNGSKIHKLEELVDMAKAESSKHQFADPASRIVVVHDESAKPPPGKRLLASDLHIARTYCIGARPATEPYWRYKVRVQNFVFSTQTTGTNLSSSLYHEDADAAADWRRGFYGKVEASWIEEG